jgi:hypothetical protein
VSRWYNRDGTPFEGDLEEWARMFEMGRRVALTRIQGAKGRDVTVSTVFLGSDHNYWGDGPPLIFESMAFPGDSLDEEQMDRYPTEAAALAGHRRMVEQIAGEMTDPIVYNISDEDF